MIDFRLPHVRTRSVALTVVLILLAGAPHTSMAQDKLEKAAWVTGSILALGVYDYVGYNLTYQNPTALKVYRVSFVLAQAALTYLLYEKFGLPSAIGFNLIWWTFGVDMVYYGVCELNPNTGGSWAGRGSWAVASGQGIPHAWWTPVGLVRGADPNERIAGNTIAAQSIVGYVLGIGITISF